MTAEQIAAAAEHVTLAAAPLRCGICFGAIAVGEVTFVDTDDSPMHLACAARRRTEKLRVVLREFPVEVPGLVGVIAAVPALVGESLPAATFAQLLMEDVLAMWRAEPTPTSVEAAVAAIAVPVVRPAAWLERMRASTELVASGTWPDALLLLRARPPGVPSFAERKLIDGACAILADGLARAFDTAPGLLQLLDDEPMDLLLQLDLASVPGEPFGPGVVQVWFAEPM